MARADAATAGKTTTGKVLVWLLIAGICVPFLTEVGLRVVLGIGNPVLIAPDAACGYTLKPDQDIYRFFVHTHINHWGMRSDEAALTPAPGTLRILFLGDSITYGTSRVDQKDIFTGILRRDLPQVVHRPVEILNASAGGWAIDNELSYLRSSGAFDAAMVVAVLNSGDLTQPRATLPETSTAYFVQRPATALGEIWDRFHPRAQRHPDAGEKTLAGNDAIVRANLKDLDEMKSLAVQSKARLVLFYIPFRGEIPLPSEVSRRTLAEWANRNSIPFVDLTELEAQYGERQITLDGIHLNKVGNALAASYLMEHWPFETGATTDAPPADLPIARNR